MKLTFILLFLSLAGYCQEPPPVVQQQLEELGQSTESEELEDDSKLLLWDHLKKHRLNINTVKSEELESLSFLTPLQIQNFIEYRNLLGEFIDIYELQAVPGFDPLTIEKILPYLKMGTDVSLSSDLKSRFKYGDHQLLLRWAATLEKAKGFDRKLPVHFLGDGNQFLLRYRYQSRFLQYGFLGEKDKGEQFFRDAQSTGFDFYSFHLFIKNLRGIKAIALGDYQVNLGQGLVHWQSAGSGKGMQVLNIKREGPALLPYRSAGEFNFLRGGAIHFGWRSLEVTSYISYRKLAANAADSLGTFSGFNNSGLFRTVIEINDKNKIGNFIMGTRIQWKKGASKIAFNGIWYRFSKVLEKSEEPYNIMLPALNNPWYLSVDYSKTIRNFHFFGEIATNPSFHFAFINGLMMSVDPKVDLAFLFRSLPESYLAIYGNAFTENNIPGNEKGMYTGIVIRPLKGLTLNAYIDIFSFPWLKYRVDAPSNGKEILLGMEFRPSRQSILTIIFREKQKPLNSTDYQYEYPESWVRQSLRLHLSSQYNKILEIRARVEVVKNKSSSSIADHGFLFYLEPVIRKPSWQIGLRVQWFDTESYDSRIYSFEGDVLFSSSIVSLFEKGFRCYLNSRWEINKNLSLSFKVSQTTYPELTSVGTGYTTIPDNKKTDLKAQLLFSF